MLANTDSLKIASIRIGYLYRVSLSDSITLQLELRWFSKYFDTFWLLIQKFPCVISSIISKTHPKVRNYFAGLILENEGMQAERVRNSNKRAQLWSSLLTFPNLEHLECYTP